MSDIRTININLTDGNIAAENNVLGFQGEHNATTLSIVPPDEMTNCEDIVAYRVAFELNNCRHTRSELLEKTSPVTVLLSSQITSSKEISVQLEGYSADGNLLVKSPKVTKLTFADSVGGVSVDYENEGGTASDITANTLARHTHENAEVLNNLSENESGNLTYNGKEIGGSVERATGEFTVELSYDGASRFNGSECLIQVYEEFENVTVGTEIKDIQFMNSDGKYISIKNLAEVDLIGYIPLFHKVFSNDGILCYAIIRMIDATYNWVLSAIQNGFTELWMKVIYYKD